MSVWNVEKAVEVQKCQGFPHKIKDYLTDGDWVIEHWAIWFADDVCTASIVGNDDQRTDVASVHFAVKWFFDSGIAHKY